MISVRSVNLRPSHALRGLAAALLGLMMAACVFRVTYFDTTTYRNLTDLKPAVLALYDTFTQESVDEKQVADLALKLAQAAEYEKGKGEANHATADQFAILQKMFRRHVALRLGDGAKGAPKPPPWSDAVREDCQRNMAEAFDIAIQSENLKNKR